MIFVCVSSPLFVFIPEIEIFLNDMGLENFLENLA